MLMFQQLINANEASATPHLCAGALVGVFPRLQRPGPQRRQLGLKDGDAAPRGGHELVGSLQRRAQGAAGLGALAEHRWQ